MIGYSRKTFKKIDYSLLFTFTALFIFIGNIGRIPFFHDTIANIINGHETLTAILASQFMSNVPAAILLSGFTRQYADLIIGLGIKGDERVPYRERLTAIKDGILAIIMPLIIIGGIVSGIFTPTESGAIAVIYALVIGMFVYKEFTYRELPRIFLKAASMTGMALLIVAGASIFSWLVAYEKFPKMIITFLTGLTDNKYVIMMLLVLFLLFVGMFIETLSATIICAPILMPVAAQYGIDPIQFALIMVITLVYAGVTPPVGGVLFITMGIAKAKMKEALTYLAPYLGIICIVILLLIFVPQISLLLPRLLF